MTILGLILRKQAGIDKMDYHTVPKKILAWMLREARGDLKATVGNRVKPDHHFIRIVFCFFQPDSCAPWQAICSKACQHILDIVGLSQAEV